MSGAKKLGRRPLLAALAASGVAGAAQAQAFPSGRVTFVVPFPPGASTDISTRIVADKLTQMWGQPVLIDNKGGANGIIAAEAVMRAKPDGYTVLATSSMTHAGNPSLYEKLSYDAIKDFEPITRFSLVPMVVLANKELGVNSLTELTARLKAEPGKHAYGWCRSSTRC
jgi:tripartite-type tricarboxylate transporter receptor subunit TctC